jgi:hypothetical protein
LLASFTKADTAETGPRTGGIEPGGPPPGGGESSDCAMCLLTQFLALSIGIMNKFDSFKIKTSYK